MSTENTLKYVEVYTDGGCLGNPGPGGYGVLLLYRGHRKELSGGFSDTTNNRMELTAAIVALDALKNRCKVTLYSDSKYLVDSMSKGWAKRWEAKGWMRSAKNPAINNDLWKRLLKLCGEHDVEFVWVKGHADSEENNRCDGLSVRAANRKDLPPDEGYRTKISRSKAVLAEGEPCRKCSTPLVKKAPKPGKSAKVKSFYYEYFLLCPGCKTIYMPEQAKREIEVHKQPPNLFTP